MTRPMEFLLQALALLAVLTGLASIPKSEAQISPVTTVQKALTTSPWIAQPRFNRCINRPIGQFAIPNNNLTSLNYTISYRSSIAGTQQLTVPGALLINDYDVQNQTSNQTPLPLQARPSMLAELCSELPYLLFRSWPSTSYLNRNTGDLFNVAADGCELLATTFGSANHTHMQNNASIANSLQVIASSAAQVLATNGRSRTLATGTANNPFADKRTIDVVQAVLLVRDKLVQSARTIQARSPAHWAVLKAIAPFNHLAYAAALNYPPMGFVPYSQDVGTDPSDYLVEPAIAFAGTLQTFLLSADTELVANRDRRSTTSFPWTLQDHKLMASVWMTAETWRTLLLGIGEGGSHISMDLILTNATVQTAMGTASSTYLSGVASMCQLENAIFNTSLTMGSAVMGTPWFSTRLSAPSSPLALKNSPHSDAFVVSAYMPANPGFHTIALLNALGAHKGPVGFNMELTTTVRTGTAACPNLPIVPLTVQPAYGCADPYGSAPARNPSTPQYEKLASNVGRFAAEYVDYALADEWVGEAEYSEEDALFADDVDERGAYSVGDELAMDMDSWGEDWLDEAGFAFGDSLNGDEY